MITNYGMRSFNKALGILPKLIEEPKLDGDAHAGSAVLSNRAVTNHGGGKIATDGGSKLDASALPIPKPAVSQPDQRPGMGTMAHDI